MSINPISAVAIEPTNLTLADLLLALDQRTDLPPTKRGDLRSSVVCVAKLLGDVPARIPLDFSTIGARLDAINPIAAGIDWKTFANIRYHFVSAVRKSRLLPGLNRPRFPQDQQQQTVQE